MEAGKKTVMPGGVVHCRPSEMEYVAVNIYGTMLSKSPVFEGDHDVRSAFFKLMQGDVIRSHRHTKWVQVAVVSGSLQVEQEGADMFRAQSGDVYFLDPGHQHVETALKDTLVLATQGEDRPGWQQRES